MAATWDGHAQLGDGLPQRGGRSEGAGGGRRGRRGVVPRRRQQSRPAVLAARLRDQQAHPVVARRRHLQAPVAEQSSVSLVLFPM